MTCLCSATWAWFSAGTAAEGNELSAGKFGLSVSVTREGEEPVSLPAQPQGQTVYTFSEVGVYTVELSFTPDTTVSKGFCVIKAGNAVHYTAAIEAEAPTLVFALDIREAGSVVSFLPSWGYPAASELVEANDTLVLPAP